MATKTFNTLSSENWTVPVGATISYADLLSPGVDGGANNLAPGFGGVTEPGVGDYYGGNGTADATGVAGSSAVSLVNSSPVSGVVALDVGDLITLAGAGGAGKFAGGGGPGVVAMTVPTEGAVAMFTISSGNVSMTVGSDTVIASKGISASGDTPGTGGAITVPAAFNTWVTDSAAGDSGTVGSRTGGFGGIGGEFHRVPSTPVILGVSGDTIRVARNSDYTEIKNVTSDLVIYRYGSGVGDYTDFSGNSPSSATEKAGGSGDETYGGGGGAGQTFASDANDGGTPDGGTGAGGHVGGDGGSSGHHDGHDGLTFGDGGGGAGPFADAVPGAGQWGFAEIVYSLAVSGKAMAMLMKSGKTQT